MWRKFLCYLGRPFAKSKFRFVINPNVAGQDEGAAELFEQLGLRAAQVDLLFTAFKKIDLAQRDQISRDDILHFFELEPAALEVHLFSLFDEDKTGKFTFAEFVGCFWNFLTMPPHDLPVLVYLMKDITGKNRITYMDVKEMLEVIHRKKVDSYLPLSMLFERYLSQNTGIVDLGKFCNWVRLEGNDSFVHPLLALQVHLRTKLLGNHFWDDLAKERKADEYLRNTLNAMQLQNEIISTARKEKEKQRLEKLEEERLERIGKGKNGDTRDYNTRKRSFLLDFFNLKAEAPSEDRAKGVYCTSAPDEPKMDRQAEILKQTKLKPGGAMSVIEAVHHTETNHKQQKQNRKSRVSNANQVHVPENKTKEEAFGYRRKDRLSRESVGSEEVDTKKSSTGKRLQKAKSLAQGLDSRQATTGVSLAVRRRGIVTTFEQLPKRMIAPDVEDESDISDVHRAALQNKRKERYTIDTADYYSNPSAGNDNRPMSV